MIEFFQIHCQYLSSLSFNSKKLLNFRYLVWVFFVYGEPVELLNDDLILIFNYYTNIVFISYNTNNIHWSFYTYSRREHCRFLCFHLKIENYFICRTYICLYTGACNQFISELFCMGCMLVYSVHVILSVRKFQ